MDIKDKLQKLKTNSTEAELLVHFFQEAGRMKKIKRTGWVREGIPDVESVADHAFRTSFMTMILAKKSLNMEKLLKLALLHDLGEAFVGDRVWARGNVIDENAKNKKEEAEKKALKKFFTELHRLDLYDIFIDYIEEKSEESKFMKQVEKLEMALQAYEYEVEHGKDLTEFFVNTKLHLKDSDLIDIFNHMISTRGK